MGNTKAGQHLSGASFAVHVHNPQCRCRNGVKEQARPREGDWDHQGSQSSPGHLLELSLSRCCMPLSCSKRRIPFLGRDLGVPHLIWLCITRGTFCCVGSHPQRMETVTISLTKGYQNDNTQLSSLDPWVRFHYLFLPAPSLSFFSLCIFFMIFVKIIESNTNILSPAIKLL